MSLLDTYAAAIASQGPTPRPWPPPLRPPLPPFPRVTPRQPPPPQAGCWASAAYVSTLPFLPPDKPDVTFHRGNFCPWLPEGVPRVYPDTPLILTWDLVRMSADDQVTFLKSYYGTHAVLSRPQTLNFGKTLGDLEATAGRCKDAGLFVTLNAFGGDGETWPEVKSWLDSLSGTFDILCECWQGDKWYSPMELCRLAFLLGDYAHAKGLKVAQHWINDACAWWNPADEQGTCQAYGICDRFSYQQKMTGVVDFHYFQCDTEAPVNDIQEGLVKVLQSLTTQQLVFAEYDAQAEFDDPARRPELYGAQKGYLGLCAQGFGKVIDGGYLGPAWRPDGSVL